MVKNRPGYDSNRARIALALSEFTLPLFSRTYHAFGGDMVAAIVLGEIAHRNVEAWLANPDRPEDPLWDDEAHQRHMRPCNALSIAQACGLPRETVRRKVLALIEQGHIYRSEEGFLYLSPKVDPALLDLEAEIIGHLLTTARRLEALLAGSRPPLGPLAEPGR